MNITAMQTPIAASLGVQVRVLSTGRALPDDTERIRKPTHVLVSQRFPGRRFFQVGAFVEGDVEEALAHLLLANDEPLIHVKHLYDLLVNVPLITDVVSSILPRPYNSHKRGDYYVTEEGVYARVETFLTNKGVPKEVTQVFGILIARAMKALGYLSAGVPTTFFLEDHQLVASINTIERLCLVDALKPALSDTVIRAKLSDIDLGRANAGSVIAQRIVDALGAVTPVLLEMMFTSQAFSTVLYLINLQLRNPAALPRTIDNHPTLIALSNYANFLSDALMATRETERIQPFEYERALKTVHAAVTSMPALSALTLEAYAAHFRVLPATDAKGLIRGAIVALPLAQTSEMRTIHVETLTETVSRVTPLTQFARLSAPAHALNSTLLTAAGTEGILNIAADSLILDQVRQGLKTDGATLTQLDSRSEAYVPVLMSIGLSPLDMQLLAVARSRNILLARIEGTFALVYGVERAPTLGINPVAALGTLLYFTDPAEAVVYSSSNGAEPHTALPQRPQSMPKGVHLLHLLGADDGFASGNLQTEYGTTIEFDTGEQRLPVRFVFKPTGRIPNLMTTRSRFAAVLEPAVRLELSRNLWLLKSFSESEDDIVRHRSVQKIANFLAIAFEDSFIQHAATAMMQAAIIEAGTDARALTPYVQRLYFFALLTALSGILFRMGVLDSEVIGSLMDLAPMDDVLLAMGERVPVPDLATLVIAGQA